MENLYSINNELYHFGHKGMKWGIRNYQNPDGSLTEAGRKRYGVGKAYKTTTKNVEKGYNGAKRVITDTYKGVKTVTSDTYKGLKTIKSDLSKVTRNSKRSSDKDTKKHSRLSDEDLKYRINRLEDEKRLMRLNNEVNHPTKSAISEVTVQSGKRIAQAALVGAGLYTVKYCVDNYGPKAQNKAKSEKVKSALEKVDWEELSKWMASNPNKKK